MRSFMRGVSRPLHEAKAVKDRFDDLFASSRYVKALDAIRKSKLEEVSAFVTLILVVQLTSFLYFSIL